MTDEQIIKALECCSTDTCFSNGCPLEDESDGADIGKCTSKLSKLALDLINRQKAEIERLKLITTNKPYCVSIGTADIFTENHEEYEWLFAKNFCRSNQRVCREV